MRQKPCKLYVDLFPCDPEKNTECNRYGCMYNPSALYPVCCLTTDKKYMSTKPEHIKKAKEYMKRRQGADR